MNASRLAYMDIAKAIMITLLMYGHFATDLYSLGIESSVLNSITRWHDCFLVFYMQGFFLITGHCSNFGKPIKPFFITNFKALIIPALLFTLVCRSIMGVDSYHSISEWFMHVFGSIGYWFLWALFFGKLLYVFIRKCKYCGIVMLMLLLLGALMSIYDIVPNFLFFQNTLICMFFLYIGECLKKYDSIHSTKFIYIASVVTFTAVMSVLLWFNLPRPSVTAVIIMGSIKEIPLFIVLAILGSFSCLALAKVIGSNIIMELIGRHTLVIYGVHVFILLLMLKFCIFVMLLDVNDFSTLLFLYLTMPLIALFLSLGISLLFNKYQLFKLFTGKW